MVVVVDTLKEGRCGCACSQRVRVCPLGGARLFTQPWSCMKLKLLLLRVYRESELFQAF